VYSGMLREPPPLRACLQNLCTACCKSAASEFLRKGARRTTTSLCQALYDAGCTANHNRSR
jgi:hypothetical protein